MTFSLSRAPQNAPLACRSVTHSLRFELASHTRCSLFLFRRKLDRSRLAPYSMGTLVGNNGSLRRQLAMTLDEQRDRILAKITPDQCDDLMRKLARVEGLQFRTSSVPDRSLLQRISFVIDYALARTPFSFATGTVIDSEQALYDLLDKHCGLPTRSTLGVTLTTLQDEDLNWRPRSILYICSAPLDADRLRSDLEFQKLQDVLDGYPAAKRPRLESAMAVTLDKLPELLRTKACDLIHFSGHGHRGRFILEDGGGAAEEASLSAVAGILNHLDTPPRYVVTMACSTRVAGPLLSQNGRQAVCCAGAVDDRKAILFVRALYAAMFPAQDGAGPVSFQACVEQAKRDSALSTGVGDFLYFS